MKTKLTVNPGTKVFYYDVTMSWSGNIIADFKSITHSVDSNKNSIHTRMCFTALKWLKETRRIPADVVYDGNAELYSNKKFGDIRMCRMESISPYLRSFLPGNGYITISVKLNVKTPEILLTEFKNVQVQKILGLIMTHELAIDADHVAITWNQIYAKGETRMNNGTVSRKGYHVSVSVNENVINNEAIQPILIVEHKESHFFKAGNFGNVLTEFMAARSEQGDWAVAEKFFAGVQLRLTYKRDRIHKFEKFSKERVENVRLEKEDTFLVDYVRDNYGLQVVHLLYPAEECTTFNLATEWYPLEFLEILPDQKLLGFAVEEGIEDPSNGNDTINKLILKNEIAVAFGIH